MIFFRTNAGQEGLGHVNRIYSLYKEMKMIKSDFLYLFLVNSIAEKYLIEKGISKKNIMIFENYSLNEIKFLKEEKNKLFILDTYKANRDYINKANEEGIKTALFIDTLEYVDIHVDILINGNIYADSETYKNEIRRNKISFNKGFLGTDFLIINPTISHIKKTSNTQKQITITTGGSDPNNFMPLLMKVVQKSEKYKRNIIIGPFFSPHQIKNIESLQEESDEFFYAPKSLNHIIARSDLIISSAGSTVYEILYYKKPFALFQAGNDQRMIIDYFKRKGIAIINLENADNHLDIQTHLLLDPEYTAICKSIKKITKKSTNNLAKNLLKEIT